MKYYYSTILKTRDFNEAIKLVSTALKEEGFGVLTEIDVGAVFKKKLDIEFRKYKILGACNPHFAHKALSVEQKIGVFLPCNVVIEENVNGDIEVSAVDPIASMSSVENAALGELAIEVQSKMKRVVESLR